MPWTQHVAFLDDTALTRDVRASGRRRGAARWATTRPCCCSPLGNEIPPSVVRWHGAARVERFLRELYDAAKAGGAGRALHLRQLPADRIPRPRAVRRLRLQRLPASRARTCGPISRGSRTSPACGRCSWPRPAPTACAKASEGQAARHGDAVRAAFEEGAAGAIAFAWTDEWWRGGHPVTTGRSASWTHSVIRSRRWRPCRARSPRRPSPPRSARAWPSVSVVVCAYNAAETLDECLGSLESAHLPGLRGRGRQRRLARCDRRDRAALPVRARRRHPERRASAARNVGLAHATGDIVAYTDADVRVDPDWLTYPRPALPVVGRRGQWRSQRRSRRRLVDGPVPWPVAGRTDARPVRRSHRRARARLQHGVPA